MTTTPNTSPNPQLLAPPDPATRVQGRAVPAPWIATVKHPVVAAASMALIGFLFGGQFSMVSIGFVLVMMAWSGVIIWSLVHDRDAQILGIVSTIGFLGWFAWRASPWLLTIDMLAFLGVGMHVMSRRGSVYRSTLGGYLGQWLDGIGRGFTGFAVFQRAARSSSSVRSGQVGRLLRQAIIPTLIVLLAFIVLSAGDQLFASYLSVSISDSIAARIFFALLGVGWFMYAVGASARPKAGGDDSLADEHHWSFPATPVLLTEIGLGALLCVYGAVQISAALLGAEYVRSRTGLSYAEWARQGFVSIAVVAVISTAVLGAAAVAAGEFPARRPALQRAAVVLAAAVCGIALSSILKLAVYTDQYGLTMMRVYTITFTGWLALVALMQLGAIWAPQRSWLTSAVLVSALIGAFAMNIVNPERIVINTNIDRAISGVVVPGEPVCDRSGASCYDTFDPFYASSLSADAVSVGLERLDELPDDVRARLQAELCGRQFSGTGGLHYNRSIRRARAAQRSNC